MRFVSLLHYNASIRKVKMKANKNTTHTKRQAAALALKCRQMSSFGRIEDFKKQKQQPLPLRITQQIIFHNVGQLTYLLTPFYLIYFICLLTTSLPFVVSVASPTAGPRGSEALFKFFACVPKGFRTYIILFSVGVAELE